MRKPPLDPETKARARRMRIEGSVAEEILWKVLRGGRLGFKFRRQHPIAGYYLDFYCHEARLAVELDGEQHIADKDAIRDRALAAAGIDTVRIPNPSFLMLDPDEPYKDWVKVIIDRCEARAGRKAWGEVQFGNSLTPQPPLPEGEGE